MEFIKRHYEKLILALLLLLFLLTMAYLLYIISDTAAITKAGLKLPEKEPDYTPVVASTLELSPKLKNGTVWNRAEKHGKRFVEYGQEFADLSSDLVDVYAVARCPHCLRLIPRRFFDDRSCPLCGKALKKPSEVDISIEIVDSSGIPDSVKEKYGIDKNDPLAVLDDMDKDGFSNLYEYKNKTEMNDPRSRPPLWHRLVLTEMSKGVLPFSLMKVNTNDNADKNYWLVQINNTTDPNRIKTNFLPLGGRIKMDNEDYRISEIKPQHVPKDDGSGNIIDKSVIELQNADKSKTIVMPVGEITYTPEPKIHLTDVGDGRKFVVDISKPNDGGRNNIVLGRQETGYEIYQVIATDQKNNTAMLSQVTLRGRTVTSRKDIPEPITKAGKIPVQERVRIKPGDASAAF